MDKKLSGEEKKILKTILSAIEARIRHGSLQGGLTAEGVDWTIYYMFKKEQ